MNNIEMQKIESVIMEEHVFILLFFCIKIILQKATEFILAPRLLCELRKHYPCWRGIFLCAKIYSLCNKRFAGLNFLNQFLFSLFNVVFLIHLISI